MSESALEVTEIGEELAHDRLVAVVASQLQVLHEQRTCFGVLAGCEQDHRENALGVGVEDRPDLGRRNGACARTADPPESLAPRPIASSRG